MTLVSSLIADAFRESNIIPLGRAPSDAQSTEALRLLQNIFKSVFGNSFGYILGDWTVESAAAILNPSGFPTPADDFTVAPNSRLICALTAATTLQLDPTPMDGQRFSVIDADGNFSAHNLTLDANGRLIQGQPTLVISTNNFSGVWFYRAEKAAWYSIPLTFSLTTTWPLPGAFDDYFIIMLAMRLNPRYGRSIDEASKARLDQQMAELTTRYAQSRLREAQGLQSPQPGLKGA